MHELLHLLVPIKGTSASFSVSVTCTGERKNQEGNDLQGARGDEQGTSWRSQKMMGKMGLPFWDYLYGIKYSQARRSCERGLQSCWSRGGMKAGGGICKLTRSTEGAGQGRWGARRKPLVGAEWQGQNGSLPWSGLV